MSDSISNQIIRELKEPPFVDFEVNIEGQKYLFNKAILALHSHLILNFVKENPGKELFLSVPNVSTEDTLAFLNSFYEPKGIKQIISKMNIISLLILSDFLETPIEETNELKESLRKYIKTALEEFTQSYLLPFTEFTSEIELIFKLSNNSMVYPILIEVINNIDTRGNLGKAASCIQYIMRAGLKNFYKWVGRTLAEYSFPGEFIQKLNLPTMNSYIFEFIGSQLDFPEPKFMFRALQKRVGDTLVPLTSFDVFFLEAMAVKARVFIEIDLK